MVRRSLTIALVASVLAVVAANAPLPARPTTLGVTGRTNANPSLAASGSFVAVTWGATTAAGVTDIFVATSNDNGTTFGAPVQLSGTGSRASLSGEQPPRIAVTPGGGAAAVTIAWTSKQSDGTHIVAARSVDGGRTFTAPAVVAGGSDAVGNRGWESIASTGQSVAVIWLDHRDTAASGGHAMHQHGTSTATNTTDATARAQLSKLWFARIGEPASMHPVAAGVCYCCKTSLVAGSGNTIYAAWRHVYAGSRRDIAFAMSRDGGRTFTDPVRVSEDDWQLDGCPENGPSLALGAQGNIHILWPTVTRESGRERLALFYSVSRDGRTFTRRQRVPTTAAAAYHPQLTVGRDGHVLATWDEIRNGKRYVRFARGTAGADGSIAFASVTPSDADEGSYPAIVETSAGSLAAWAPRSGSSLVVKRIPG